jgi:SAM-dependent methyltransferase
MRIKILRDHYCARCPIVKRSPRSTGVKLLLSVTDVRSKRVLDFGCGNWRNSKYLESLGAYVVKMDAIPDTKPDVVAYPTHLPFRDKAFDVVLYTHILMFLNSKKEWLTVLDEPRRISRGYLVVETYRVSHKEALKYTVEELNQMLAKYNIIKRHLRPDLQVFVAKLMG